MDPRQLEVLAKRLGQNPSDAEALQEAYTHGQTDPRGYAVFLEKAGANSVEPENAAHWYSEAAQVWLASLNDAHRAVRALMSAVDKDPTHEASSERLAAIYREKGDLKGVVALLDRRAKLLEKLSQSRPELADTCSTVLIELARVQSEELGRPDGALAAYKRAMSVNRADSYSIYMARELYKSTGRYAEAIPLFAAEQRLLEGDTERSLALYADEIEVCREAGDTPSLMKALRASIELDPDGDPALKQQLGAVILERIQGGEKVSPPEASEGRDLFVSLAEAYDGDYGLSYATCALGCDAQSDRAMQLALYYAEPLGRLDEVAPFAATYLTKNPDGVMAKEARAAVSGMLTRVYDESLIAALRPEKSLAPEERAKAWVEVGRAYAAHAKWLDAEKAYREATYIRAAEPEALDYLATTYRDASKYRELYELLGRASKDESADPRDRIGYLEEIAAICDGPLHDVNGAIEARRQLLLLDPSDEVAADQLEATLTEAKRWDDLAELMRRRVDFATDSELKLSRLQKLVLIERDKRNDKPAVAAAFSSLSRLEPDQPEHAQGALEHYKLIGRRVDSIALLNDLSSHRLSEDTRAKYCEWLGDLYSLEQEAERAGTAYAEAAAISGGVSLWDKAEQAFVEAGFWDRASQAAEAKADLAPSLRAKAAIFERQSLYLERQGDGPSATQKLADAVRLDPERVDLAQALETRYRNEGRLSDLAALLLDRASVPELSNERVSLLRRAAEVFQKELRDAEGMRQALVLLLESGEDADALRKLADDAESNGDLSGAIHYHRRLLALLHGPDRALLAHRVARLLLDTGDDSGALEHYDIALAAHPNDHEALLAKARLELKLGDARASAASYRRLTDLSTGEKKLEYARELVTLMEDHLGDPSGAVEALEMVIDLDKEDFESVAKLATHSEALGRYRDFVKYQQQLVDVEGDEEEAARMGLRLAHVLVEQLGQKEQAMNVLAPFAREGVDDARALYIRLGDELGRPGEVAVALRDWLKDAAPGPKRNHGLRSAFDRFVLSGSLDDARDIGVELVKMKGVDLDVARQLETIATQNRDVVGLRAAFAALAREAPNDAKSAEIVRQAELLRTLDVEPRDAISHGEVALTHVDAELSEPFLSRLVALATDPEMKIGVYERQVGRTRTLPDRRSALCRTAEVALELGLPEKTLDCLTMAAHAAGADPDQLEELISEVRERDGKVKGRALRIALLDVMAEIGKGLRDGGALRGATLRRASRLAYDELGDSERAFTLLRESLIAQVKEETLEALEEIAISADQLQTACEVIEAVLLQVHDGPLVRMLLRRRYDLRKNRMGDSVAAASDLKRLYDLSPGETDVAEQLEQYYQEAHDMRGLAHLYEDRILRSRDALLRVELARKVALLWQNELKNPRETADAWRRVLRLNPSDIEAKELLDKAKHEMRKVTAADLLKSEEAERQHLLELEREDAEKRRLAQEEARKLRKEKEEKLKGRLRESLPPPPDPTQLRSYAPQPEAEAPPPPEAVIDEPPPEAGSAPSEATPDAEASAIRGDALPAEGAEPAGAPSAEGERPSESEARAEPTDGTQEQTPQRAEARTMELSPEEARVLLAEAAHQLPTEIKEPEASADSPTGLLGGSDDEVTALHRMPSEHDATPVPEVTAPVALDAASETRLPEVEERIPSPAEDVLPPGLDASAEEPAVRAEIGDDELDEASEEEQAFIEDDDEEGELFRSPSVPPPLPSKSAPPPLPSSSATNQTPPPLPPPSGASQGAPAARPIPPPPKGRAPAPSSSAAPLPDKRPPPPPGAKPPPPLPPKGKVRSGPKR